MGKHEDIWNVAKNIEGLISRRGVHASGIILTNDKFTELGATMKSPKGVKCSQWELHDEEYAGHIKYDFLTIDGLDRIRTTMELLLNDGLMECRNRSFTLVPVVTFLRLSKFIDFTFVN